MMVVEWVDLMVVLLYGIKECHGKVTKGFDLEKNGVLIPDGCSLG